MLLDVVICLLRGFVYCGYLWVCVLTVCFGLLGDAACSRLIVLFSSLILYVFCLLLLWFVVLVVVWLD